jgi:hypothetical protein
MSIYTIALFIHVVSDIGLMAGIGIWLVALAALRRAERVEHVRAITGMIFLSDTFYRISGALLLSSGVYMTITVWGFDTAWIDVALATLFLVVPVGPLVAEPRMKAIAKAAGDAAEGAISPALRAQIHSPVLATSLYVMATTVLGIVFLMTTKPALVVAIVAVVAAIALGAAISVPLWRAERVQSAKS